MSLLAFEGVSDPEAWARALGPVGLCLAFALIVVLAALGTFTLAATGIPRWKIPGLAWTLAGVWRELHGLRVDLRAFQSGDPLPELPPLADSVPPPPALPRATKPAQPVRRDAPTAPPSRRSRQDSRPK